MASPRLRFLHPYYVLNGLLILTYTILRLTRLTPEGSGLDLQDMFGFTREMQVYLCLGMLLATRLLSAPTMDVYLSSAFNFCRLSILLCLWYMDATMLAVFGTLWVVIYVAIPQPRYALQDSLNVTTLNPLTFRQRVLENTHETITVVWCHAPWSPRCSQLTPVFAEVARRFKHPRVVFSRVDLSKFSKIADDIGDISTASTSKQLPTVIAYKQGKEVGRIPVTDDQGRVPKQYVLGFTKDDVINTLRLESLFKTADKWEKDAQKRYQQKRKN